MQSSSRVMWAALAGLVFALVLGAAPLSPAPSGVQRFGAPVTLKKSVDVAKLEKAPEKFVGRTVRLEGTVKDVCQGMGCWIEVAGARGGAFLAKSLDESVTVPKDCTGRAVVVQGVVTRLAPRPASASDSVEVGHACPRPTYLLSMLAVELAPAK